MLIRISDGQPAFPDEDYYKKKPTRSEQARVNGAKSKGPSTPEGKKRSSKNALKHGFTSTAGASLAVLSIELDPEFQALLDSAMEVFRPDSLLAVQMVDEITHLQWCSTRCRMLETGYWNHLIAKTEGRDDVDNPLDCESDPMAVFVKTWIDNCNHKDPLDALRALYASIQVAFNGKLRAYLAFEKRTYLRNKNPDFDPANLMPYHKPEFSKGVEIEAEEGLPGKGRPLAPVLVVSTASAERERLNATIENEPGKLVDSPLPPSIEVRHSSNSPSSVSVTELPSGIEIEPENPVAPPPTPSTTAVDLAPAALATAESKPAPAIEIEPENPVASPPTPSTTAVDLAPAALATAESKPAPAIEIEPENPVAPPPTPSTTAGDLAPAASTATVKAGPPAAVENEPGQLVETASATGEPQPKLEIEPNPGSRILLILGSAANRFTASSPPPSSSSSANSKTATQK